MTRILIFSLAGIAGLGLGVMFFGGLWWTIRRGLTSPRPAMLFLGSALLRMAVALAGFYLVAGGEWPRLVACLIGFLVARSIITRLTRRAEKIPHSSKSEARHATHS